MIYEQTPIRLKVVLVGAPPVYPLDQNTGQAPKFWRASSVGMAVGIFDASGDPVDLTNLAATGKLQLSLMKTSQDFLPLVVKQIDGPDLVPTISTEGWENGTQQQGVFILTPADTDQALGGATEANFWLVLNGITDEGALVLYAAGPCTIYNASLTLPPSAQVTPSYSEQVLDAGNITITPTSNIHQAVVTVGGDARTSNIIVGQSGLRAGARVDVLIQAQGAAADIDIQLFVGSLSGANPFAFNTSGGATRALFKFYFDGAVLQPLEATVPAY